MSKNNSSHSKALCPESSIEVLSHLLHRRARPRSSFCRLSLSSVSDIAGASRNRIGISIRENSGTRRRINGSQIEHQQARGAKYHRAGHYKRPYRSPPPSRPTVPHFLFLSIFLFHFFCFFLYSIRSRATDLLLKKKLKTLES